MSRQYPDHPENMPAMAAYLLESDMAMMAPSVRLPA
jgi:hypothetical protein